MTPTQDYPLVLNAVEGVINDCLGGLPSARNAVARARERAEEMLAVPLDAGQSADIAQLAFAADVLGALAGELARDPVALRRVIDRLVTDAAIPRLALATAVMRGVAAAPIPGEGRLKDALTLALAFTGARFVSLWCHGDGEVSCVARAGTSPRGAKAGPMTQMAAALLDGHSPPDHGSELAGVLVTRRQGADVALVAGDNEGLAPGWKLMLEAASEAAVALLEREESEPGESSDAVPLPERRLARLRFDLHDGPQQDVILLAEDLQLFGTQLERVVAEHPDKDRLLGRLEDLQARLVALDGDLRRISSSLQSPFLRPGSLPDAIDGVVNAFSSRTGIDVDLAVEGDMSSLTDSQHITLLGLIRESLSNVREHSEATHVDIKLSESERGVQATVVDNGRGFDPETSLVRAARAGHLGLVGMHERVRMLGGTTDIDSRPGGPTVISVSLPAAPVGVPRRTD